MPLRVVLLLALTLLAPASALAKPKVLTQRPGHLFQAKPASIGYTGDGTGYLGGADGSGPRHPGHLDWTAYGKREGRARGVVWLNECRPSCADGRFVSRPVRVRVFRPRQNRFTRMTLKYRYRGKDYDDTRLLRRLRDTWVWGIA